jgi:hypothetical protein
MTGPYKVAGSVDSWCGRCKLILTHTIETLEAMQPARVHCNSCGSQHAYKPYLPGEAPRQVKARERAAETGRPPPATKSKPSDFETLMRGRDGSGAPAYSPKLKLTVGDVIRHPTFGVGVTVALKDSTKAEILFGDGPKVLIHNK